MSNDDDGAEAQMGYFANANMEADPDEECDTGDWKVSVDLARDPEGGLDDERFSICSDCGLPVAGQEEGSEICTCDNGPREWPANGRPAISMENGHENSGDPADTELGHCNSATCTVLLTPRAPTNTAEKERHEARKFQSEPGIRRRAVRTATVDKMPESLTGSTNEEFAESRSKVLRMCQVKYMLIFAGVVAVALVAVLTFLYVDTKLAVSTSDSIASRTFCKPVLWTGFDSLQDAKSENAWARQSRRLVEEYKASKRVQVSLLDDEIAELYSSRTGEDSKAEQNATVVSAAEELAKSCARVIYGWLESFVVTGAACDRDSQNYANGMFQYAPQCSNLTELIDALIMHATEHSLAASAFLADSYRGPVPKVCACMEPDTEKVEVFAFFEIEDRAKKSRLILRDQAHYYLGGGVGSVDKAGRRLPEWITVRHIAVGKQKSETVKLTQRDIVNCVLRCEELMPAACA